jgi:hypothetical protein
MIDHIIPASTLEAIPAKIYSILKKEFDNQAYQFGNTDFAGLKFMRERTVPVDKVDADMITIMTASGDYSLQSVGSQHAAPYTFILEFITKAKNTPSKRGDQASGERLIRLMSMARYILMSPLYVGLEISGAIESVGITKMQIYKDERIGDAENIATGQFLFSVWCDEVSAQNVGTLLTDNETNVTIELTEQGYQYNII